MLGNSGAVALRYRRRVSVESPMAPVTGGDTQQGRERSDPGDHDREGTSRSFHVQLENFEGPFDLLLQLISARKLDVTEVSLSQVTDEFIAHITAAGGAWDLNQTTEFLLVAATLLDLKAARLLPAAEIDDEEDLALLEARDLLFARLLQYRAYKQVATFIEQRAETAGRRYPRAVALEPRLARLMPEVLLGIGVERFVEIAVQALTPREPLIVAIDHIHAPKVSVREHAAALRSQLSRSQVASFRTLCAGCETTLEVVARFLALLELYREGALAFDQLEPLGELTVRWVAGAFVAPEGEPDEAGEYRIDEYDGAPVIDEGTNDADARAGSNADAGADLHATGEQDRETNDVRG